MVWLIILAFLILINLCPVGIDLAYENRTFSLYAKLGFINIRLIPKKNKHKKHKNSKQNNNTEITVNKKSGKTKFNIKEFTFDEIIEFVYLICKFLKRFLRGFKIKKFKFWFVSSSSDPYSTVEIYNNITRFVSTIQPILSNSINPNNIDIKVDADFYVGKHFIEGQLIIIIRIGTIFITFCYALLNAIKLIIRHYKNKRLNSKKIDLTVA